MSTVNNATTNQDAEPEYIVNNITTDQVELAQPLHATQISEKEVNVGHSSAADQIADEEQAEVNDFVLSGENIQDSKENIHKLPSTVVGQPSDIRDMDNSKTNRNKADNSDVPARGHVVEQVENLTQQPVQRKLSHDPTITLENVLESGGCNAEELRLSNELRELVPTARPDQIVRFLRARKGNVQAAAKMLRNHLEWRAQYVGPNVLNPENDEELKEELLKNKICFFGNDMLGNKVVILRANLFGKHTYKDFEVAKRALAQIGEVIESICEPLEKITCICSNKDITGKNHDLDWLKEVARLFQHNYPERLGSSHQIRCGYA